MLSEKEKKAIEYYKNYVETMHNEIIINGHIKTLKVDYNKLKTIVNLIEKQQAEIEKKDKIIDKMGQELFIEIEPHFDTLEQCIEFYTNKVEEENK